MVEGYLRRPPFDEPAGIYLIPARPRHGAPVTAAQARRVTRVKDGGFDSEPQFSPDGQWIVFTRFSVECTVAPDDPAPELCTTRIFRVRSDGRSKLAAAHRPRDLDASAPDFHPSGRWIAFDTHDNFVAAERRATSEIMRPDGSDKRVLLRGDRDDYFQNPSFSPDGRQMTFARWAADVPNSRSADLGRARRRWRAARAGELSGGRQQARLGEQGSRPPRMVTTRG